jgi:hypothetical protein
MAAHDHVERRDSQRERAVGNARRSACNVSAPELGWSDISRCAIAAVSAVPPNALSGAIGGDGRNGNWESWAAPRSLTVPMIGLVGS